MVSGIAGATTITQTIDYGPGYTDWSNSYVFNQFNPALGALNSVTIESQGFLNIMTATFTNAATTSETLTSFQETFQTSLTGPGGTNQNSTVTLPSIRTRPPGSGGVRQRYREPKRLQSIREPRCQHLHGFLGSI